jgi:hypothetical protein
MCAGEILLVESLDLKATLQTEGGASAECIVPWNKGFLVGQGNGAVSVFDRDDKDSYRRTKVFSFAAAGQKIKCMALTVDESQLAVTTEGGKIYTLAIANIEILKQDEDNFDMLGGMELPAEVCSSCYIELGLTFCVRYACNQFNWQYLRGELQNAQI